MTPNALRSSSWTMPRLLELDLEPRPGAAVLEASLALAEGARKAGAPVVAIRVERPNVDEQPPGSGLAGAVAKTADAVVVKRSIGGFYGTDLDAVLKRHGAETLVMAGIMSNLGVESTARAAADHGYELVFVEDAMSALSGAEHEAATGLNLPRFGEVVRLSDLGWRTAD
ncbi:isochorismatase family protein [Glycomyces algeriensis]|uniref:Hydrolase n=1 Tax=Glycomyces algeriensis TaxID=256037 RepID=A0A9W6GBT0_9ACTN|nr:isochorismatase family protein [Glycomyces algeriensis]MDA1365425.1 isochorismatase family protein [Glycomyces algeriensis]MDR7351110.1 nicotinamidase-related amidase [Glycomyces algeriensis]GLI43823.1 hydrolase [Glycomyces algeriensis]